MAKDDFISRIVGDPKNPRESRLLQGWLGDAAEETNRRLYTDLSLSSYVDIPTDAILHTEPLRDSQPPGAVFVWYKADANVQQGGSAAGRAARFLQGPVTQTFGAGAPGGGAGAGVVGGDFTLPTGVICLSAVDGCPTRINCDTKPPTAFCSQFPEGCQTQCGRDCQTPQPGCTNVNCTQAGPDCPPPSIGIACTVVPTCRTNPILDCTFGCTIAGAQCPETPFPQCAINDQTFNQVGAAAGAAGLQIPHTRPWLCIAPTPATRCFICPPITRGRNCDILAGAGVPQPQAAAFSPITVCNCPQGGGAPQPQEAFFSPITVCNCPQGGGGTQPPHCFGPTGTQGCTQPPHCFGPTGTQGCTQNVQQCPSIVDACPTRINCPGGGGDFVGAAAAGQRFNTAFANCFTHPTPTPQTRCFVCDPPTLQRIAPTPATRCFIC